MGVDTIVGMILGGGGIFSGSIVLKYLDGRRKGITQKESTAFTRLEDENKAARKRADEAEAAETRMRAERDAALDTASYFRRILIEKGFLKEAKAYDER